jgi:hypothetical protein
LWAFSEIQVHASIARVMTMGRIASFMSGLLAEQFLFQVLLGREVRVAVD